LSFQHVCGAYVLCAHSCHDIIVLEWRLAILFAEKPKASVFLLATRVS